MNKDWSFPTWSSMASCMNILTCHVISSGSAHSPGWNTCRVGMSESFPCPCDTLESASLRYRMLSSWGKSMATMLLMVLPWWLKRSPDQWLERGSTGDGEGAQIHMPIIRLEIVENHWMYYLMPSDDFIVKKSGTQAGIEPTTFGVLTHCSNHWATEALVTFWSEVHQMWWKSQH